LIELSQRMDNWGFECCWSCRRGLRGLLLPLIQYLPKLEFRKSWKMTLQINISLTLSSTHTVTLDPKENR
jgi:hypothetical protein